MTTRPGYIWSGTEWVSIGQEAVVAPVKYQTSAPSSPATGDIWIDSNDDVPGIDTSQFLRWRKTMSGGETSVSGTDDNGLTLQYTANYEQVYLNGVLLVRGQDYTATNGTSITGLTALAANDVVEVFGVVARVVGDVYTQAQADAKYSPVTTTGLVLLNTTTFSASSATSVNNVFTTSYDYYLIIMHTLNSTNAAAYLRFRANGTDNTSSSYKRQRVRSYGTTVNSANDTQAFFEFASYFNSPLKNITTMNIGTPVQSESTTILAHSGTIDYEQKATGYFDGTNSFDGFTVYPSSGTLTGTIKVYGYK